MLPIQPLTPPTPMRPAPREDAQTVAYSNMQVPGQSNQYAQTNEIGDKAIEPAAPPSALQMQIQALISEQAQPLPGTTAPDPAETS